ncbi:hypothetical protein DY000_02044507 [Brassica cretica]|uniref:Pectinesterase inhibitor domain-containing protein n=1 Tax=Brassica cretica TaxID=69181 RepID=A0ABQ7F2Q2_BRACR|nr:hypothetical protein DY000_02044507 [Brassica cretica]
MGKVDATIPDYSVAFVESIIVAPLQPPTSLETLDRSDPNALPITSSTEETSDLAEKTVIHAAEGDERNEPQDVPSNVDLQMLIFLRDQRPRSCHLRAALKKDKETSGDIYYFRLPTISSLPAASALPAVLHVTTAVLSTLPAAPPSTVEFSYSKITSFVNNIDTCVDLYRQINSGVKNLPALKDLANPEGDKDVSCT